MESIANTAHQLLLKLIEAATETGQFIAEQIPDVIQQLLLYNLILHLILFFVFLPLTSFCVFWMHKVFTDKWDSESLPICMIILLGSGLGTMYNATMAIKIWIAPKVWLLEYAADLIK